MKILYDHQIFTNQVYGGISRYFFELIKYFENNNGIKYELSLKCSNNYYLKKLKKLPYKTFLENFSFRGKYRLLNILNKEVSKKYITRGHYDIFHPTYYNPYFLDYVGSKPFVLTVYDMIHEKFKEMFSAKDKTSEYKKLLSQKASKGLKGWYYAKHPNIEIFNIEESKIEVVYLGNSMIPNNNTILDFKLPKKYIIFVGARGGYKNFDTFIKSVTPLLYEDKELSIVCVGGGKFKAFEIALFNSLDINKQIQRFDIDDDKLAIFYKNAILFVFPSLYEGFGIPILESFACKCPLACSNTSSLPEIAGDGAEYFDPTDKLSILNSIQKVLYNDKLRKQLINKGIERMKEFTWEKTADKTKHLYKKLLL